MQKNQLPQRPRVLEKIRLDTGETLWASRCPKNQWRITNIPVSTNRVRFGDIVRLKNGSDGFPEIDAIEARGHYSIGIIVESDAGPIPTDFISQVDGVAPWERLDGRRIAITMTKDTWEKVCALVDNHHLHPFRVART